MSSSFIRHAVLGFALISGMPISSKAQFYEGNTPKPWRTNAEHMKVLQHHLNIPTRTTEKHLHEDTWDRRVCKEVFLVLAKDSEYAKATATREVPSYEVWKNFLGANQHKSNVYVRSLARSHERFSVYFSFHEEFPVAYHRGLNCHVATAERVQIAERQGVDNHTFALRQREIKNRSNLQYPKDGLSDGVPFETYEKYLVETYQLYSSSEQRLWMRDEVKRVISELRKRIHQGSPDYPKEGVQMMREWITKLERFTK